MPALPASIFTIGHSTRTWDAFLAVLAAHGIQALADVRRFPGSRRYPWFSGEAMATGLAAHGVDYLWLPQLGGRRSPVRGSINTAWRSASFQGYADHLSSAEFAGGCARLLDLASRRRTAIMCAEVLWWQCHRALISDVLKARGMEVWHVADEKPPVLHPYSSAARIVDGSLTYAPAQAGLF